MLLVRNHEMHLIFYNKNTICIFCIRNMLLRDSSMHRDVQNFFSSPSFFILISSVFPLFPPMLLYFSFPVLDLAVRADINECELVPVPCAFRCVNSPGSYKCLCPPGLHLLGDGKSCAGLERLPSYESFSYGYRTSQSSSDRSSYQQRYHSLTSQSFHSHVPIGGRHMTNRLKQCPITQS